MLSRDNLAEAIIKNEFDHSYLLFPMKEDQKEEYSFQMLSQNTIPGLLSCHVRYIEELSYFSYEISSKKSLLQEYSDKKIGYKELKELFHAINTILKNAAEFLLEKEGFVFEPEYIFIDLETEDFCCVYLPVEICLDSRNKYRGLADFLLDRTDHKDEHAVNIVYQFYKMSKEEFFSFDTFIGFMEKEELIFRAQERRKEEKERSVDERMVRDNNRILETQEREEEKETEKKAFHWKVPGVLSAAGILLIGIYLFVPMGEKLAFYFLLAGLTIIAVAVILWGMAFYNRFGRSSQEDFMELDTPVTVEEYFDDMLDNETVYFDEELTLRLKWKEGRFSKEYALTKYPVTVGKLRESVQLYIEDASISRLHARFTLQDETIIVQDLDSTNGTWVNGKKLAAGEEAVIRRNDEIQFGKIIVNVV